MTEICEGKTEQQPLQTIREGIEGTIPAEGWKGLQLGQKARTYEKRGQKAQARNYYYHGLKILLQALQLVQAAPQKEFLVREAKEYSAKLKELMQPDPESQIEEEKEEAKLREKIRRRIIQPDKTLSRKDLIGLDEAYRHLWEVIFNPIIYPRVKKTTQIPRNVLLFGPPGCGKTMMIKILAAEANIEIINVSAADLMSKWLGESQKMIKALYETAWEKDPSIIFIDEFDGMFGTASSGRRGNTEDSITARQMQHELLVYMDGVKTPKPNPTVTIVATNYPCRLEQALLRRFDRRLYLAPPRLHQVKETLIKRLNNFKAFYLNTKELEEISQQMCGYSYAEIERVVSLAIDNAIRHKWDQVSAPDLTYALQEVKPDQRFEKKKGVSISYFEEQNDAIGCPSINYRVNLEEINRIKKMRERVIAYQLDRKRRRENVWFQFQY